MFSNAGIKAVCVLVALVLWVQVASNHEVEDFVDLPLTVVGLADSLVVRASSIPDRMAVRIRGDRLQLMTDRWFRRSTGSVEVNLRGAQPGVYRHNVSLVDVRTSATPVEIVDDRSLDVIVHRRVSRVLPVRLAVQGQLPQDFTMAGRPEITPAEVTVTGPAPLVDALSHINTEPVSMEKRRGSFTERAQLAAVGSDVQLHPVEVDVAIGVDEIQERSFSSVPISVLNTLDASRVHVEPMEAQVRVVGPGGIVQGMGVQDVSVLLHVGELEPGVYQLDPEVVVPDGIASSSVDPVSFQVIIGPVTEPDPVPAPEGESESP